MIEGKGEAATTGPIAPPESISVRASVERQWQDILVLWKNGWHSESAVERLEDYIEYHRKRIFEGSAGEEFDWKSDWVAATHLHDWNSDFVRNRRAHNEDLQKMWFEWHERNANSLTQLSLEALRAMILIDGAAILACLTLLSGQISNPNPSAVLGAKVMLLSAIVSLLLTAVGHMLGGIRANEVGSRVRGVLVGNACHRRLYAIGRYMRRYFDPALRWSEALIYSGIFVFALSAFISAVILVTEVGWQ